MSLRWRMGVLALVVVTLVMASALGSPAGDKKDKPEVILFQDINYGGRDVVLHKDIENLTKLNFNDEASSLKWHLPPDMAAVLFIDADYQKPLLVLVGKGHFPDLGKLTDGNDSISSVAFMPCPPGGNPKGIGVDIPRVGQR